MTAEALATWDRAVDDLRAAGATVEPFDAAVTRVNYRDLFAEAAKARGDVEVDPKSPAPTANALLRYFTGRTDDPRMGDPRCGDQAATRRIARSTTCSRRRTTACVPLLERPMRRRSGRPLVRALARDGRARAGRFDARGERRGDGVSDDAVQRADAPSIPGRTSAPRSATATGSASRKCRFPPATVRMECRRSTCRSSACRARMRACSRWRTRTSASRGVSGRHRAATER